jgi:Zn-dependent protease
MHFGVSVPRILLLPIGGMAELDDIPREPQREVLIAVAGPAVNFAIIFVLWIVAGWPTASFFGDYPATLVGSAHMMIHFNLMMGTFNFLPAFPMDGGRILRALLAMKLPYLRATFWAATVGKILASFGVVGAFAVVWLGRAPQPYYQVAALFAFIFVAGEIEYRVVRRRERDDAHWRATFERLSVVKPAPPPAPPPVLTS